LDVLVLVYKVPVDGDDELAVQSQAWKYCSSPYGIFVTQEQSSTNNRRTNKMGRTVLLFIPLSYLADLDSHTEIVFRNIKICIEFR